MLTFLLSHYQGSNNWMAVLEKWVVKLEGQVAKLVDQIGVIKKQGKKAEIANILCMYTPSPLYLPYQSVMLSLSLIRKNIEIKWSKQFESNYSLTALNAWRTGSVGSVGNSQSRVQ